MSKKVYLTVTSDAKRIPGQIIHYAQVHDLNDHLIIGATLDYVLAAAQERGFEFVGENPLERQRQEVAEERRRNRSDNLRTLFVGPVEYIGPSLDDAGRDFDAEADAVSYERGIGA